MDWLTPPSLYIVISFIVLLSLIIFWKRPMMKREIARWRAKEINMGPVKLERGTADTTKKDVGVSMGDGNNFTGARISRVAGRDILTTKSPVDSTEETPGVDFGKRGDFRNADVSDVAGRDIVEE